MSNHPENWTSKSRIERDAEIVSRLINANENDKALEIAKERGELVWVADDGNVDIEYPYCDTRSEAARDYVDSGDWGDLTEKHGGWVTVYTWPRYYVGEIYIDDEEDRDWESVELKQEEPDCSSNDGHDWKSPIKIVGGIKENPGVWGHGGGVIINECCMNCGCKKTIDTWAQNPENGEQGLTTVTYEREFYSEELYNYLQEKEKYA